MKQITITEMKKMKVPEFTAALPVEIMADGAVIGVLYQAGMLPPSPAPAEDISKFTTKCPNCKLVYQAEKPDNKPFFLSMQGK